MSKDWKAILRDFTSESGQLAKAAPDTMRAFGGLVGAASKDGALDKKTKELMAVAVSICLRCDGCIAYHTNAAIKAGASREEMADTIALAIEMGGGPSAVYGSSALTAYDQLSA